MKNNKLYIFLTLLTLVFTSCQEDLYTGPCNVRFKAYVQNEVNVTRADYISRNSNIPAFDASLYVSFGDTYKDYVLNWNGSSLSSSINLETGNYNFYGYAPKTNDRTATFDLGNKTLTIPSIPALYDKDLMVIKPCSTTVISDDISSRTKTVALQMDHLLAKITPCFYLNSEYAKLRNIKIKKVEFFFDKAPAYNATIKYASDYSTTWDPGTEAATTVTAFSNTNGTDLTITTAEFGCCYIVPEQPASTLKMKVTYDVYDKVNNTTPIRSDEVVNKVIIKQKGTIIDKLSAGNNYILNIQVVPTYLYVLSDNDQGSVLLIQ